jgi:hypothetical protein
LNSLGIERSARILVSIEHGDIDIGSRAELRMTEPVGFTGGNCMQLGLDVFVVVGLSLDV